MGYNQGKEAPRQVITDYQPCDACAEKFKQGFLMIECSSRPNNPQQPPDPTKGVPHGELLGHHLGRGPKSIPRLLRGQRVPRRSSLRCIT